MRESRILAGRALCILHVDDHALNRRMVGDVLAACGHQGVEAQSGAEALKLFGTRLFDLVLMDINMPGMSGVEVVARLRNLAGPAGDTPVIALTSEVARTTADYLTLGFNGYVPKPFNISDLLQAIEHCARPISPPAQSGPRHNPRSAYLV